MTFTSSGSVGLSVPVIAGPCSRSVTSDWFCDVIGLDRRRSNVGRYLRFCVFIVLLAFS